MSKVISVRLSDDEDAQIRSGAAIYGLSFSEFIKSQLREDKIGTRKRIDVILYKLDRIDALTTEMVIAQRSAQPVVNLPHRETLFGKLKARGIPSSTVRQVEIVLDEMEGKNPSDTTGNSIPTQNVDLS